MGNGNEQPNGQETGAEVGSRAPLRGIVVSLAAGPLF